MMMLGLFDFLLFAALITLIAFAICHFPHIEECRIKEVVPIGPNVTAAARSTATNIIGKTLCFDLQGLSQSYIVLLEKALLYFISKALLYFISKAILYYENMANL